jgi:hypothetical protein
MMPAKQVFTRVIIYGLVLSAVDAVTGRLFQASPGPSVVLSLGATAWAAYRLAQDGQERLAVPAGITLFGVYLAAFVLWATLLVGWNRSVAWRPRSTTWLIAVLAAAPVVAIIARMSGAGARAAAAAKAAAE